MWISYYVDWNETLNNNTKIITAQEQVIKGQKQVIEDQAQIIESSKSGKHAFWESSW